MANLFDKQRPIGGSDDLKRLRTEMEKSIEYHKSLEPEGVFDSWWGELLGIWSKILDLAEKHPTLCRFILLTAAGAVGIPILLQIAGFSLAGPLTGSLAAWWQSTIGDVAAESFFAWLQSLGMLPATAVTTGALIGIAGFVWVEIVKVVLDRNKGDENGEGKEDNKSSGNDRRDVNSIASGFKVIRKGFRRQF